MLRPVLLKPMAVRITASASSGVSEIAPCVAYEPNEKPISASLRGLPILPVYFPSRTKLVSRCMTAMAVLIWASNPEILQVIVNFRALT